MLFSNDKEILRTQLQEILPFGSSFDFEGFRSVLIDTEQRYILLLTGKPLYDRLMGELFEEERKMCRKAIANIAVYENFTLLNTKILPGGFTRLTGENTGSLYKYQEIELKNSFRRNGFDMLDHIVCHFLKNIERFPEFKESAYYRNDRGELIPDRATFTKYYKPIGHIVFNYLKPFIRRAEMLDLSEIVQIEELKNASLTNTLTEVQTKTIKLIQPVLVNLAVAYAIEDKGIHITDAGVWLENQIAADGSQELRPAGEQAEIVAQNYRKIAMRYLEQLQKHLSGCGKTNPYIRDNRNKKTAWL